MPSDGTKKSQTKSSEAPASGEPGSVTRSEDPRAENQVLDFLYHDARRIASFLAQFETYGVLQAVKATEGAGRSAASTTRFGASGGVPQVLKGEAVSEKKTTDSETDAAEHTYDPLWRNGLALFRYLESEKLIHKGLDGARGGQFVLVSGDLSIRPASLMLGAFGADNIRQGVIDKQVLKALDLVPKPPGPSSKKVREARQQAGETARRNAAASLDLITSLPFSMQVMIETGNERVWCNVADDFLSMSGSDLALTYGSTSLGKWQALGVFDAQPSAIPEAEQTDPDGPWDADKMVRNLANTTRRIAGRPADAYAITPLLIFREIIPG